MKNKFYKKRSKEQKKTKHIHRAVNVVHVQFVKKRLVNVTTKFVLYEIPPKHFNKLIFNMCELIILHGE